MPRKHRVPKPRGGVALTPAWVYQLMVGAAPHRTTAPHRLPGWSSAGILRNAWEPTAADVWAAHGAALTRDAAAHDFQPYMVTRRRPRGDGFRQWEAHFLSEHLY